MPADQQELPVSARGARERILEAAYELFVRHGVRAVGIDAIIARARVARMSLYNHFASKEELVLAFLTLREQRWTQRWFLHEVQLRGGSPREQLLGVFDVLDEWFQQPEFAGCPFIRVLLESTDRDDDALRLASAGFLRHIRESIAVMAVAAQIGEPEEFARQWQILMKGAIISAQEGDLAAAQSAKRVAALLLAQSKA